MNHLSVFLPPFGVLAFLALPAAAFAQLCTPNTRCIDYSKCYINNVPQPCAYGSGGAFLGGIIFRHGDFEIEWQSDGKAKVTYGKRREFKATAIFSVENGYRVLRLSDGVVVKYPASGGINALNTPEAVRLRQLGGPEAAGCSCQSQKNGVCLRWKC